MICDYNEKKYFRYLYKYVGVYRICCEVDPITKNLPRDSNGELYEDFEDLYIKCRNGKIKHGYGTLFYYISHRKKATKNIYKNIKAKHKDANISLEITSGEGIIYFYEQDLDKFIEYFLPSVRGKKISPFSARSFDKNRLNKSVIPPEQEQQLKDICNVFEVPIDKAIFVRHVVKKFLLLQIQKEEYRNIIDEAKKEDYTNKECIYINGLWDEFLDFAKQQVEQELKETKK